MAHGPKNDYPHISLKDTSARVNKRGINFLLRSTFVSRKFAKTVQDGDHFKNGGHYCAEYPQKNFAPEKCESKFAFFLLCIRVGGIGRLFNAKTRVFV